MRGRPNVPLVVLSLAISSFLWLVVYGQNLPGAQPLSVSLVRSNLDGTKFFVSKIESRIHISVIASTDKFSEMKDAGTEADVDLSEAKPGVGRYPVIISPAWVQPFLENKNLTAEVTIEPIQVKTGVILSWEPKGSLSDPNLIVDPSTKVSRPTVTIRGPRSEVEKVTRARVFLDEAAIDPLNPIPQPVSVEPLESGGIVPENVKVDPPNVVITPILVTAPIQKSAVIFPVFVGSPAPGYLPNGYQLEKDQISITGPADLLAAISKISTEPISVAGVDQDTVFKARLKIPRGAISKSGSTMTVHYLVKKDPNFVSSRPTPPSSTTPPVSTSTTGGL